MNENFWFRFDFGFCLRFTVNDVIADDEIFVILLPITFASV